MRCVVIAQIHAVCPEAILGGRHRIAVVANPRYRTIGIRHAQADSGWVDIDYPNWIDVVRGRSYHRPGPDCQAPREQHGDPPPITDAAPMASRIAT